MEFKKYIADYKITYNLILKTSSLLLAIQDLDQCLELTIVLSETSENFEIFSLISFPT